MKMSETTTTGGAVEVHYQTPEEKLELNRLGMWVFLASEVMFFGGLFTIYLVYRWLYPQVSPRPAGSLTWSSAPSTLPYC